MKQVLRKCRVFESLGDAELEMIGGVSREYKAGATIFNEGSKAEDLYVVEDGKVAIQMQVPMGQPPHNNKRVTVDVVTSGEVFGWSAVVDPYQYTLTAVCLEPTKVLAINGADLRNLLRTDHRIGYEVLSRIINVVASRLDETRRVLISERMMTAA